MPDFSQRSALSELMDSQVVSFEEFHACLLELEKINTLTLAYHPTLRWLQGMSDIFPNQTFSVLDIGCGGGDMLRHIWRWAQKHGIQVNLVGVDINPWSKKSAELSMPQNASIRYEVSDIFTFDPSRRFDLIINSLFTHHLDNYNLVCLLKWMEVHAIKGWFINDLHRHPLPYFFIKYAVRLFSANRLVRHNAPLSVARAFVRQDWQRLGVKITVLFSGYNSGK